MLRSLLQIASAAGMISFGFFGNAPDAPCHHAGLKNRVQDSKRAVASHHMITTSVSCAVAAIGYYWLGDKTPELILSAMEFTAIGQIALGFMIFKVFTGATIGYAIDAMLFEAILAESKLKLDPYNWNCLFQLIYRASLRVFFCGIGVTGAIYAPCISLSSGVVGALIKMTLGGWLPCVLYLKLHPYPSCCMKFAAWLALFICMTITIYSSALAFMKFGDGDCS